LIRVEKDLSTGHTESKAWHRLLSGRVRAATGIALSFVLLAAAVGRTDLQVLGDAIGTVSVAVVLAAALLSTAEVSVRAARWRLLLSPFAPVSLRESLAYLTIGHLLNAVLPARLGDVMRALLTGIRQRVSSASVLGTIAVERLADALLLGLAVSAGVLLGFRGLEPTMFALLVAGAITTGTTLLALFLLRQRAGEATIIGSFVYRHGARFLAGAAAVRRPRLLGPICLLTFLSFALAVGIFSAVAVAVGLPISAWQSALVIAAVTLSTAIPAGPASIGTYEFVGMTVMTSMGYPPEASLLCVALVHLVALVPASLIGLASMWWLGIRLPNIRGDRIRLEAMG
jgi:uncharacterized protein (TIRG00374 family)